MFTGIQHWFTTFYAMQDLLKITMSVQLNPLKYSAYAKKASYNGVIQIAGINFGWGGAAFLLWHSTEGQELPQADMRQVVVLTMKNYCDPFMSIH